jgi:prepilin-type N-terminal cleavage/methylation domain-containing protein/prepilin-type processing-associated H-X9-DG protein
MKTGAVGAQEKAMKRKAFTLIELLVVIAIIAILAAILFPVFAKARDRASKVACVSNTNQIGKALLMYVDDNNDCYPANRFYSSTGQFVKPYTWKRALLPYTTSIDIWKCPSNRAVKAAGSVKYQTARIGDESNAQPEYLHNPGQWLPGGYGYNAALFYNSANNGWYQDTPGYTRKMTSVKDPAGMMVILETRTANPDLGPWVYGWTSDDTGSYGFANAGGPRSVFFTHGNQMNLTFADGHTKSFTPLQTYQQDLWGIPKGSGAYGPGTDLAKGSDIKNWPVRGHNGIIDPADVQ